jgi:hypothetical protein
LQAQRAHGRNIRHERCLIEGAFDPQQRGFGLQTADGALDPLQRRFNF